MKYTIVIVATITLMATLIISGCDSSSNRMENTEPSATEANRDREIANNEVEAELRVFRTKNENRMAEHDRTIEDIKQKIENEPDRDVRDRLETKLERYETNHRELKRDMNNYRASGKESWNDFKDSFSDRMDDLGDSLEDFFSTSSTATVTY